MHRIKRLNIRGIFSSNLIFVIFAVRIQFMNRYDQEQIMVCVSSILHTTRAEHGVCEFQEQSMVCVSSILHTTRAEHGVCEFHIAHYKSRAWCV